MTNFQTSTSHYGRPEKLVKANYEEIDPLLVSLLERCTPHGFEHYIVEIIKAQPYIKELVAAKKVFHDPTLFNNVVVVGKSSTVFSCHMDIVGHNSDKDKYDKISFYSHDTVKDHEKWSQYGMIWGGKETKTDVETIVEASTLGADDKVGVYILLKMIEAGIPGKYIFHVGEELGGKGSSHLASKHKHLFDGITKAIAFDRANYTDIIGFQRGRRCCSVEFGKALAAQLNAQPTIPPLKQFTHDVQGTFTDTASYMDFIPECSNVSVGYFNQHGSSEHLDTYWLQHILLPAILKVDYESLPVARDPSKKEYPSYASSSYITYPSKWSAHRQAKDNAQALPWDEVTKSTPFLQFPLWEPSMGWPDGASGEVLHIAIFRYIGMLGYTDRDDLVKYILDLMEYKDILEEETISLHHTISRLKGEKKQKLLPPPKTTYDIGTKKSLLTRLIVVADLVMLPDDKRMWLDRYTKGAKDFLVKHFNTVEFTEKHIKKFNTYIYSMGSLIDQPGAVLSDGEEKLLDDIREHILDTHSEKGWFIEVKGDNNSKTKVFNQPVH